MADRHMREKEDEVEKPGKEKLPEAPWVEVYHDFFILETTHGCLVKVDDNVTFVPNGTLASFHVI